MFLSGAQGPPPSSYGCLEEFSSYGCGSEIPILFLAIGCSQILEAATSYWPCGPHHNAVYFFKASRTISLWSASSVTWHNQGVSILLPWSCSIDQKHLRILHLSIVNFFESFEQDESCSLIFFSSLPLSPASLSSFLSLLFPQPHIIFISNAELFVSLSLYPLCSRPHLLHLAYQVFVFVFAKENSLSQSDFGVIFWKIFFHFFTKDYL